MLSNLQIAALLSIPNIGKKSVIKIIESNPPFIKDPIEFYNSICSKTKTLSKSLFLNHYEKVIEDFDRLKIEKINTVGFNDIEFPILLKEIQDPPVILYYRGDISCLNDYPTVAVIGTRNPSVWGDKMGHRVGEHLAENNITVVSGLALGCDTAAHKGCLSKNGRTAAFLAHGLHKIYPRQNQILADQIIDSGGCLLSEYSYGIEPQKYYFVERDRLQSGSSLATVVIETNEKGGSMHTVKFKKKKKRLLYCISHPVEKQNDMSKGNKKLIEEKRAVPVKDSKDVYDLMNKIKYEYFERLNKSNTLDNPEIFEENNKESNLTLSIENFAKRVNRKPATVKKYFHKPNKFKEWSNKLDPDYEWKYDDKKKLFYGMPIDNYKLPLE